MAEKITPANLIAKLQWHQPEETPAVCLIAKLEIERLTTLVKNLRTVSHELRGAMTFPDHKETKANRSRILADAFKYDDEAQAVLSEFGIKTNEQPVPSP